MSKWSRKNLRSSNKKRKKPVRKSTRWSRKVKDRDGYMCVICHSRDHLVAHHIIYRSLYPKLRLHINNGITLCKDCEMESHSMDLIPKNRRETYPSVRKTLNYRNNYPE